MGLIKITADMTESERTAVINTNMQYLQLSNRLRKYPIGMIVSFATDINPNELFGGTWERIKGRVIWGIDDGETAGCTGGEKTHTLTEAELPAIDGRIATAVVGNHNANGATGHAYGTNFGQVTETIGGAKGAAGTQYGYGYKFGDGQPHNNMMPYYGAYVWRKTGHGIGEDPTLTEYEAFVQQMNTAISEALSKERLITNTACANALRGTASGAAVSLTDVSPNEHTLGVKVKRKNLFDKNNANIIAGYIDANVITAATTSRCIYIPCNPNTTYTVSKIATARYVVAFTNVIPTAGTAVTNRVQNYTATSITATSGADSKYIVVWLYNNAYDTTTTIDEILATVQIELGSTATVYTPYISDLTTVTATRYGKNLIPYPYTDTTKTLNGITFTVNSDGSVTVSGTATAQAYFKLQQSFSLKKGQYFFSGCPKGGTGTTYSLYLSTSDYVFYKSDIGNGISINAEDDKIVSIVINIAKDTTVENLVFKPQLELGSTATAYEPYTAAEYTPAADGTVSGVKSLYPTTTLMTDTEGAIIDAKYNRDINKAFAEMQQAILSIGGNV